MEKETEAIENLNHMTALELSKVYPIRTEKVGSRVVAFYPKAKADKIVEEYNQGLLECPLIEAMDALRRVKDRIFETERRARR